MEHSKRHAFLRWIARHKIIVVALFPIFFTLTTFILTLVFLQASDAFSAKQKSPTQNILHAIGDAFAVITYASFSLAVPLGLFTALALFIVGLVRKSTRVK